MNNRKILKISLLGACVGLIVLGLPIRYTVAEVGDRSSKVSFIDSIISFFKGTKSAQKPKTATTSPTVSAQATSTVVSARPSQPPSPPKVVSSVPPKPEPQRVVAVSQSSEIDEKIRILEQKINARINSLPLGGGITNVIPANVILPTGGSFSTTTTRSSISATSPIAYDSSTGDISVASSYTLPLTASTTNWNSFYNTPSSRITAGAGLTWSGNTLNASGGGLTQWTTTGSDIYFSTGNVGIGSTSPTQTLSVDGSAYMKTASGTPTISVLGVDPDMHASEFRATNNENREADITGLYAGATNNYNQFGNSYYEEALYAETNGSSAISNTIIVVNNNSSASISTGIDIYNNATANSYGIYARNSPKNYFFGKIGVGTTDPTQKVEVDGGLRLNTATSKPTCDSTVRGTFWFTQSGAGVKDAVEVCAKDAANAYAWRVIY